MEVWSQQVQKRMTHDDAFAAPLAYITSQFVDLYASVKSGSIVDPIIIIHQATALEAKLDAWEQLLPPCWYFTEKFSDNDFHAFQIKSHQYNNFWIARMLSNYRWIRILIISNLVITQSCISSPTPTAQPATANGNIITKQPASTGNGTTCPFSIMQFSRK